MRSHERWTLAATIVGSSMTFVDATVVNVALPVLQADLHATITDVQWVIEAYALFLGALILVGGSLGDQFGRKRVFLGGVAVFTAASVLCGVATSTRLLIVARACQGIGAAFLVPGSLAIITATFDDAARGRAIGWWSGFTSITSAIGPVLGGWLIEQVSWRAAFLVNVPLAVGVVVLTLRFVDESRDPTRTGQTDWTGAALAVTCLGGIVFGLLEWPALGPGDAWVFGAFIVGASGLLAFLAVERRSPNPMMSLDLFQSAAFTKANLLTLLLYAALGVVMFLVPLNLIQVQRYRPTEAGAAFLPVPVIIFVLSRWSGGLVSRIGSWIPLSAGPALVALGVALYARPRIGGSYWMTFFPAAVVLGLGLAVTVAPLTTTAMGAVDPRHSGTASGINNAVARVAGLLAIALFGLLLSQRFDARVGRALNAVGLSASESRTVELELPKMAGADVDAMPSLDPARRSGVRRAIDDSFVSAFRVVMLAAAALAAGAAAIGATIR